MNLLACDIVWDGEMATLEGRAAIRGSFRDVLNTCDEWRRGAEEIRDLGSGVTFSVLIQRGRPRGSAGWVRWHYGIVATWVDGLMRRAAEYLDIDEARAAGQRLAEERR